MNATEIRSKLVHICKTIFTSSECDFNDINSIDFINDWGMDSIMFISLIVSIEDCFEISIPDDLLHIDYFNSIEHIVPIIENELKKL